ncbi:uncharacterized protein LOC100897135 [Galendromus occidentalis]|uniref:Uncharacterized protein LOC100897135 n=1 Tax=Galendromus occidentalis TaxID=34638 RepID=A0AAJ6VVA8_9ACAR|nr:uncharacterized protein LOC100897135 [Galendromus occidentalis]
MRTIAILLMFLCASSEATTLLPILGGKEALRALFGAYVVKLMFISAYMQGLHSGYRHDTRKDEYEQIVQVLDVPEDLYQERYLKSSRPQVGKSNRAERELKSRDMWKKLFGRTPYPDASRRSTKWKSRL